jgi:hypothetical protein
LTSLQNTPCPSSDPSLDRTGATIESFGLPTAKGTTPSSSIFFFLRCSLLLHNNRRSKRRSARREILPTPIPTIAPVESFLSLCFPSLFREALLLLLLLLLSDEVVVMFPTGMVTPVTWTSPSFVVVERLTVKEGIVWRVELDRAIGDGGDVIVGFGDDGDVELDVDVSLEEVVVAGTTIVDGTELVVDVVGSGSVFVTTR